MSGLQKWLEKWLMPIARVLEKQKHLQAVKDGIVGIVPIIIIGSFCLVPTGIGNLVGGGLMEWVNAHNNILTFPTYFTTNIMSLYAALYIANSLAKRYKLKNSLIGASAILVHLLLSVTVTEDGTWMVTYLAAEGLFTAIISAIFAVEITRFCDKNHLTIKMPESVPPMVADSFSILVPLIIEVLVATGVAALCQNIAGMVFPQVIMKVLAPAIQFKNQGSVGLCGGRDGEFCFISCGRGKRKKGCCIAYSQRSCPYQKADICRGTSEFLPLYD